MLCLWARPITSLEALISAGYDVVGVFCQPDKPSGRGKRIAFCPVKQCALAHGIPVVQPVKTRVDGVEPLRALKPDLCVTAAFGHILSQEVLDIPHIGTVNVHASLLPKYRGSAPVNWALIQGETVTGVTTMMTDKGMDTGDIIDTITTPIGENETAGELFDRLAPLGAELLSRTLRSIADGTVQRAPQNNAEATMAPMLEKAMGKLDFTRSAKELHDQIRGMNPWPGCHCAAGGKALKIHESRLAEGHGKPGELIALDPVTVACGEGALRLITVQPEGKPRMAAADWLRGARLQKGECLA